MFTRFWPHRWESISFLKQFSRRNRGMEIGIPQIFEMRTLLTAIGFQEPQDEGDPLKGIDVGSDSAPDLGDLDGDGDLDLIVGAYEGDFHYLENTGSSLVAAFTERTGTSNPMNGFDLERWSTPRFGDLDGDGDLDLISGEVFGSFKYFLNTGTSLAPIFTEQTGANNPLNGVVAGSYSTPTLGDLDGDGDLDLVSSSFNGTFFYFKNTGTPQVPVFTEIMFADSPVGGINYGWRAAPDLADLDGDGDLDLIGGKADGTFIFFLNTGTALAPVFTEQVGIDDPFAGIDVGTYAPPAFGDLDGDLDLDFVTGDWLGMLSYFVHNKIPSDIALSSSSIPENRISGTLVGIFDTTDVNVNDSFIYTLVSGTGDTDNASFNIVGNELHTSAQFDFEVKNSFKIRVRSQDAIQSYFEKEFSIQITDVNEAPTLAAGVFPRLPDWWRKSKTNAGEAVGNIIESVAPMNLISDQDLGAQEGLAIIAARSPLGTWEYSIDGGTSWISLADTSLSNARLLDQTDQLRFIPFKKKYWGDVTLTAVAWDQTAGTSGSLMDATIRGGESAFSLDTTQLTRTVLKKKPKIL